MSTATEEPNQDGDWGWEPLGSEDEEPEHARAITNTRQDSDGGDSEPKAPAQSKGSSEKVLSPRKGSGSHGSLSGSNSSKTMQGIVSSPSFLELEKAIGATLNLASSDSGELAEGRQLSPSTSFPASKLSSTNLTQQKVNQQRMRQQQHQQQNQRYSMQNQHNRNSGPYGSYGSLPQAVQMQMHMNMNMPQSPQHQQQQQQQSQSARVELASFINESESRALILFHSVHLSAVDIRNACSKYGVLYYIRPEFHSKGVTLISYFDLRAASSAKTCIAEDLGRAAEASVHYSVMLHAANGNSEEFRLVVRNLPPDRCSEGEVQSIFARYGQLRSIQKTFEDGDAAGPSSAGEQSSGSGSGGGAVAVAAADAETGHGDDSTSSCSGEGKDNDGCKIAYSIEYYNIQDARLAASELSATSSQLWNADVTVKFAPLDERKQQLCRQLLATLSKWRTEMASAMAYNMSLQQQQQQQLQQQVHMQQQQQARQLMGMNGMNMGNMGMMSPVNMNVNMNMGGAMGYGMPQQQQQMGMGMGMMDMNAAMGMNMNMNMNTQQFDPSFGAQQQQHFQQSMGSNGSGYDLNMLQQQQQQMAMAMGAAGGMMPMQQHQQRLMYGQGVPGSPSADVGAGAVGGGIPVVLRGPSPMHALMPANLSNPNLFNLGLLAAQAEAQMQQQQQALHHQHQQAVLNQQQLQQGQPQSQPSPSGNAGAGSEGGSFGADGNSPANSQFGRSGQHQGFHAKQQDQQQNQTGNNSSGGSGRFNGNGGNNNGPRHHNQNRGGNGGPQTNAPPHHNGGYAHNNGYGVPMQMQQMPVHGFNGVLTSGGPLTSHLQQQQYQQQQQPQGGRRVGGKGQAGTGNGQQQQQYGYSNSNMNAAGGAGGPNAVGQGGGGRADTQIDADFALDLKRIGDDVETRTTIMVRNIPNKYNQQMLLEEVNVSHEGTYDFFYLPIDFKNRCNVGYCFINFLDPKHIPPFVNAFNGQRWKSFNSEKVCAVSFARIQGKQAMVARFQNSSLLEKDDEYQPLLFYSSGPDRGKPEPFPVSTAVRTRPPQQQHGSGAPVSYAQHHLQQRSRSNTGTPPVPARSASHSPVPSHDAVSTQSSAEERSGADQSSAVSSAHTSLSRESQLQPVASSPSPGPAVALEQSA